MLCKTFSIHTLASVTKVSQIIISQLNVLQLTLFLFTSSSLVLLHVVQVFTLVVTDATNMKPLCLSLILCLQHFPLLLNAAFVQPQAAMHFKVTTRPAGSGGWKTCPFSLFSC